MSIYILPIVLFRLGRILATANAVASLTEDDITTAIRRHAVGDWGDLKEDDRQANARSLKEGLRLLSCYHSRNGIKFYVITEADRSMTTILLPEEY